MFTVLYRFPSEAAVIRRSSLHLTFLECPGEESIHPYSPLWLPDDPPVSSQTNTLQCSPGLRGLGGSADPSPSLSVRASFQALHLSCLQSWPPAPLSSCVWQRRQGPGRSEPGEQMWTRAMRFNILMLNTKVWKAAVCDHLMPKTLNRES